VIDIYKDEIRQKLRGKQCERCGNQAEMIINNRGIFVGNYCKSCGLDKLMESQ